MATVWHGVAQSKRTGKVSKWTYHEPAMPSNRARMGRFLLGSTIIMLFSKHAIVCNADWAPEGPARLGEVMEQQPA